MKTLSQHVVEALFETRYAPHEIVQFQPNSSHIQQYNIADGNAWLTGTVEEVIINGSRQYYTINCQNNIYNGIPEENIKQETLCIFSDTKINSVSEQLLQETKFITTSYRSAEETDTGNDVMTGWIDRSTFINYIVASDKTITIALHIGSKYVDGLDKKPYSKKYSSINDVPAKWQNHVDELAKAYEQIIIETDITES